MVFLLAGHFVVVLFLGNQKQAESLVGELALGLRQVFQEFLLQRLRLHALAQAKYVQCRCSCGQVGELREVKVLKLFWHEV